MQFARHVKWRREKFGAVVFDTMSEKVFVTNEPGKNILDLIERGLDTSAVVECLQGDYLADEAQIRGDVTEFLSGLQSAGLLTASCGEEHE